MSLSSEGTPDLVAFEQLVAEYGDRIFGIALRVTGSPSDAEEVMQEAFLQAFRSWSTFRGESAPTTWLYRIAVNAALTRVRSRHDVELLSERDDGKKEVADWTSDAVQAVLRGELRQQIEVGITRLPEALRVVLVLRVSEAAVKSRLHRARALLRSYLADVIAER
jgi:RNA polymerase sigma-70 factor, ECF subfamily